MFKSIKEKLHDLQKSYLKLRIYEPHRDVLNKFDENGVFILDSEIYVSSQKDLRDETNKFREKVSGIEQKLPHNIRIKGSYYPLDDRITLDKTMCMTESKKSIENTLIHEYAHKLYSYVWRTYLNEHNKNREKKEKTDDSDSKPKEKSKLEKIASSSFTSFSKYIEEFYCESVSHFLQGDINPEKQIKQFIKNYREGVLEEFPDFAEKIDTYLERNVLDRLYTKGLKQVSIEMIKHYDILSILYKKIVSVNDPEPVSKLN